MLRSTRHALSGCSKYTEPHVLLTRLDLCIFGLASYVQMCSNSDNLFDHLGIFFSNFVIELPICSTLELFDIRCIAVHRIVIAS